MEFCRGTSPIHAANSRPVLKAFGSVIVATTAVDLGQGLKIIGRGQLQVDGEIEGDVQGAEVIFGEKGKVTGMVAAQDVIIRGRVSGVVCGKTVALQSMSHVEGDVHHLSLAIEQGAVFEGRSRRATDEAALNSVIDGRSTDRSYASSSTPDA